MSITSPARPDAEAPAEAPAEARVEPTTTARGPLPVGRARTIALLSLFLASPMELLDNTIVNVALPTIETGCSHGHPAAVDGRGIPAGLRGRPDHR